MTSTTKVKTGGPRRPGAKLGLVRRTHGVSMLPELTAAFVIDEFMRANADDEITPAVVEQHKAARGVDLIAGYLVRQALQHGASHFEVLKHLVTHLYPYKAESAWEQVVAEALYGAFTALVEGRIARWTEDRDNGFHVGDVARGAARLSDALGIDALRECVQAAAWLVDGDQFPGDSVNNRGQAMEQAARAVGAYYAQEGREQAFLAGLDAFVTGVMP